MDQTVKGQLYPGVDRLSENSSNELPTTELSSQEGKDLIIYNFNTVLNKQY